MRGYGDQRHISSLYQLAVPEATISLLQDELSTLGDKADGAKKGLMKIRNKWSKFSVADRAVLSEALQSSVGNVKTMANFANDPLEAMKAGMTTISQFSQLTGPKGQIASEILSFISGFISVLGAKEEKSVGEVVREQIDEALTKYREQTLVDEGKGVAQLFDTSKHYVDSLARRAETLTKDQAQVLGSQVPLYNGLKFMGKLMGFIEDEIKENSRDKGRKALVYIALYCKLATLKDLIVTQTAALLPDELAPNRDALIYTMKQLRNQQKNILKFLFEGDVKNNLMRHWDPDEYPATDHYLLNVLGVPNYARGPLNGIYCMAPSVKGKSLQTVGWSREDSRRMQNSKPYLEFKDQGCSWKFVPHGNQLYTIKNWYKCPGYDWCGAYATFHSYEDQGWLGTSMVDTRLHLDTSPMLWQIDGSKQKR